MEDQENKKILNEQEVNELIASVLEEENIIKPKVEISAGTAKGDGYLSFMTQIDVSGENKNLNLLIKCAPKTEAFRGFVPVRKMYLREMYFYEEIFPTYLKFQKERNVPKPFDNIAKFYKCQKEEFKEMLVLENIRTKGFRLWNRKLPMNDEHIRKVFNEYGKLHAVSYAIKDQQPELYEHLISNLSDIFTSDQPNNEEYFNHLAINFNNLRNQFSEETENEIRNKIDNMKNGLMDYFRKLELNKGDYSVITHGDCWCNNMMFKYEDKENPTRPTNICLLDFQVCHVSSPVKDLAYTFYVSADKRAMEHLDDYLKVYHTSLSNQLIALGSDPKKLFPYEALQTEWKENGRFGFVMALQLLRLMLRDTEEVMDLNDISENNCNLADVFNKDLKNQDVLDQRLKDIVIHMCQNEYL